MTVPRAIVYGIVGSFVVSVGMVALLWRFPVQPIRANPSLGLEEARARWKHEIDRIGGANAYAEFRDYYSVHNSSLVHALAHQMGDLLFDKLEIDGLSICDSSFGYACYHQFLARVLGEYGSDVLPKLAAHCENRYRDAADDCFHGIGHGLREYYGSDLLLKALQECGTFSNYSKSCEQGVFMDFNVPLSFEGTSSPYAAARDFDVRHPYSPCDTDAIPEIYKQSCYHALPHLWIQQVGWNFKIIQGLCAGTEEAYLDSCYGGMAVDLPGSVGYDQTRIIESCESMPDARKVTACLKATEYYVTVLGHDSCSISARLGKQRKGCPQSVQ